MKKYILALGFLGAFGAAAPSIYASAITYTFTGSGPLAGDTFTYVDPTGFLAFNTGKLTPTTETGGVTSFNFISAN